MSGVIGNPNSKSGIIGLRTPTQLPIFSATDTDSNGPNNDNNSRAWGQTMNIFTDTMSWWDSTNKRYHPKFKGTYLCMMSSNFHSNKTAGHFAIQKNAATFAVGYKQGSETWMQVIAQGLTEVNGTPDYINVVVDGYMDGGARWNQLNIIMVC